MRSDVEQSCVVGTEDMEHGTGQISVAFVILNSGAQESSVEKEIRTALDKELPEYSRPQRIVFVDSFPYTGAGKVDYRALEEMAKEDAHHD